MAKHVIRNLRDLAAEIGASRPDIEAIDRRVYKDTSCGAWCAEVKAYPEGLLRAETWDVKLVRSLSGCVIAGRRNGRGPWLYTLIEGLPHEVIEYFCGKQRPGRVFYVVHLDGPDAPASAREKVEAAVKADVNVELRTPAKNEKLTLARCAVTLDIRRPNRSAGRVIGVKVGSIVEGVDQCADPVELIFPFVRAEWDLAVKNVEDQVTEIWNATHGCPKCGRMDRAAYRRVNPKCRAIAKAKGGAK
jgi:hypothetical protein